MNYVDEINDFNDPINNKLKGALNKFFKKYPSAVEGCILRKDWDGAPYALIIESSSLYHYLQGEYGWEAHTTFHNIFVGTGWFPEMMNSCVVGFYKD